MDWALQWERCSWDDWAFALVFTAEVSLEFVALFSVIALVHVEDDFARVHCLDKPLEFAVV